MNDLPTLCDMIIHKVDGSPEQVDKRGLWGLGHPLDQDPASRMPKDGRDVRTLR
jgi:hypothetical protein